MWKLFIPFTMTATAIASLTTGGQVTSNEDAETTDEMQKVVDGVLSPNSDPDDATQNECAFVDRTYSDTTQSYVTWINIKLKSVSYIDPVLLVSSLQRP